MPSPKGGGVVRTLSHQHVLPEEQQSLTRSESLLSRQQELPKFPLEPLEQITRRYLDAVLPLLSTEQQEATKAAVADFVDSADGQHLYEILTQYNAKEENYVEHFYREMYSGYDGSNHSLNPNFLLYPRPNLNTGAKRAAAVTLSALHYHAEVKTGKLPIFETRGGPLCMRQMPWLFGTARIAQPAGVVDQNRNVIDSSRHVAVLCQGQVHKLTVLQKDDSLAVSAELLEQRFAEIAESVPVQSAGLSAVGVLTSGERGVWATERAKLGELASNAAALAAMDDALFVVALDSVTGLTPEQMELNVLYGIEGTYHNRWLDKWTLIVCEDGQAGVNWEHSMLDGHTMMELIAAIGDGQYEFDGAAGTADPAVCVVQRLPWTVDNSTMEAITAATKACAAKSADVGITCLEFAGYGSSFIKGCNCSPDGFVQAAMLLTFYELYTKLAAGYESVLAKAFKHGRVTVARNMSSLIAEEVAGFDGQEGAVAKTESVRKIAADVSRITKDASAGKEFDRPFFAMRQIAAIESKTMGICADPGWARLSNADLVTSQCGKGPIRFFGFEPPGATGFAVGYEIRSTTMQFTINNFSQAEADKFTSTLCARLVSLQQAFESAECKIENKTESNTTLPEKQLCCAAM